MRGRVPRENCFWIFQAARLKTFGNNFRCVAAARMSEATCGNSAPDVASLIRATMLALVLGVILENHVDRAGEAIVLVRPRDMRGLFLDVVGGVTHGKGKSADLEHRAIILHVADGGDGVGGDAETLRHGRNESALVLAERPDVQLVDLRA